MKRNLMILLAAVLLLASCEKTVDVELPTGWATNYYPSLDTVVAVAAKYDGIAENGAR